MASTVNKYEIHAVENLLPDKTWESTQGHLWRKTRNFINCIIHSHAYCSTYGDKAHKKGNFSNCTLHSHSRLNWMYGAWDVQVKVELGLLYLEKSHNRFFNVHVVNTEQCWSIRHPHVTVTCLTKLPFHHLVRKAVTRSKFCFVRWFCDMWWKNWSKLYSSSFESEYFILWC